jgi:hypothetical protein
MELSNEILALLHSDLEKGIHVQIANQVAKLEAVAKAAEEALWYLAVEDRGPLVKALAALKENV